MDVFNETPSAGAGPPESAAAEPPTRTPDADTARSPGPTENRWSWAVAAVLAVAAAVVPAVLWPGDNQWMNDEAALVGRALLANQRGELAREGLKGSFRVRYGPMPVQSYQFLLLFTRDPVGLAAVRGLLSSLATVLGLLWLGRSLGLSPWFVVAVVLAPYVWLYHRWLWDATYCIPVGTLGLAGYAAFLRRHGGGSEAGASRDAPDRAKREKRPNGRWRCGRWWSSTPLLTALGCMLALPLIHPQSLPLSVVVLGHLLWRRRAALRTYGAGAAVVVMVLLTLNGLYLFYATARVLKGAAWIASTGHSAGEETPSEGLVTPLLAGKILAGDHFAEKYAHLQGPPGFVRSAVVASCAAFPLVWIGVLAVAGPWGLEGWRAGSRLARRGRPRAADRPINELGERRAGRATAAGMARDVVLRIALAAFAGQMVLYAALRVPPWLSYYISLFVVYVVLAWAGAEALARVRLRAAVVAAYGLGGAVLTLGAARQIHRAGLAPDVIGGPTRPVPTLASQADLARQLAGYADEEAWTDVDHLLQRPQTLWTLRLLAGPDRDPDPFDPVAERRRAEADAARLVDTGGRLVIRFRPGPGGGPDRLDVVALPPGAGPPPGTRKVPLVPPWYWPD